MKISFLHRCVVEEMLRRAKGYERLPATGFLIKGLTLLLEVSRHDSTCGGPGDVPIRVNWTFIGGLTKDLIAALRTPRRRDKRTLATLKELEEFYALGESKVRETV